MTRFAYEKDSLDLGDTVEFMDEDGRIQQGEIVGMGAAGWYMEVAVNGDEGYRHSIYSNNEGLRFIR